MKYAASIMGLFIHPHLYNSKWPVTRSQHRGRDHLKYARPHVFTPSARPMCQAAELYKPSPESVLCKSWWGQNKARQHKGYTADMARVHTGEGVKYPYKYSKNISNLNSSSLKRIYSNVLLHSSTQYILFPWIAFHSSLHMFAPY